MSDTNKLLVLNEREKFPRDRFLLRRIYGGKGILRYIFESEPIIEEGDLRQVYKSKYGKIPEILNEEAFTVRSDEKSQALKDDMELRRGLNIILSRLENIKGFYIIVNIDPTYLPGIAEMLVGHGIDCSFVIPEQIHNRLIHDRFHETLKYWSKDFNTKKQKLQKPVGYATLIDCHRRYKLSNSYFPTPKQLKELGINKIIYLIEAPVGKLFNTSPKEDLEDLIKKYQK